jgi:DNA-binding NarL/FixJ family response regulator
LNCEELPVAAARIEGERQSGPINVWHVDDNPGFRTVLAMVLNVEEGINCSCQFPSPTAVLKALARENPPDVILLDIEMGVENGLDAIRPIKSAAPGTHVLMLTTFATPESRERAFREGASDFMLKSWTPTEIAGRIRQAMEFGSVAGLLSAFLGQEKLSAGPTTVELAAKTSWVERWAINLRGFLKFSPS